MQEQNPELEKYIRGEMEREGRLKKSAHAGETRETRIPGTQENRGLVFRYERGQILRAYQVLRREIQRTRKKGENPTQTKEFLKTFRERARKVERDLDELNRQYHENSIAFDIEGPKIGKHETALAELDLRKPEEGKEDPRIPYFVLGGIGTNYHQTAALSMALALEGQKVYALTYPEQKPARPPADWGERLKKNGTFAPHAEVMREAIKRLGHDRVNVVGFSMGGGVMVEAARDKDFNKHIQDLVILEPVGFEEKSMAKMGYDFLVNQGILRTVSDAEERLKAMNQGAQTTHFKSDIFLTNADILRKRQFDTEKLSDVGVGGRYQVWVGTDSPVASAKRTREALLSAERLRAWKNQSTRPVEIYEVEGGNHAFPLVHAMGIAKAMREDHPEGGVIPIRISDLEKSAAASILAEGEKGEEGVEKPA